MPLDAEPHPAGNIVLDAEGRAVVLTKAQLADPLAPPGVLYRSHYASCPDIATWRKRRAQG